MFNFAQNMLKEVVNVPQRFYDWRYQKNIEQITMNYKWSHTASDLSYTTP